MKAVTIELAGQTRYLCFTVEAMFQVNETCGSSVELLGAMGKPGRDGFAAACKAAAILTEQGELARRSMGYEPAPMATEEDISTTLTPERLVNLKNAIAAAIALGYGREVDPENDEVDLGLAELEAQKKTQ